MAAFLWTRTMGAIQDFVANVLVSATYDTILGITVLDPRDREVLRVAKFAISAGLPHTSTVGLIVAHPILNEGLVSLSMNVTIRS
jgi:pyruvate/2-oxoglutarate dehydrogenase complex dihydrolipoamide dehydrogenase (E3) component